jgi:hypothetical protein
MTVPPMVDSEHIDFTVLTDQFRILPTSRSWSGVQESIRTLQSRPPDDWRQPGMQDHTQNVEVFANTIREHADLIAYSFVCAATLAHLAPPASRDASTYRALQTLSSAFRFRDLSALDVHEQLRTVWTALRAYAREADAPPLQSDSSGHRPAPHEPLPDGGSPKVQAAADVEPYFVWLEKVLAEVRIAPELPAPAMARVQSEAWLSVRQRYEDCVRNVPERVPAVAEVICRIAQLLPSTLLGFAMAETPAVAWADLLIPGALATMPSPATPIPWWAHGLAAHALGFRSPDISATRDLFSFLSARWSTPSIAKTGPEQVHEWDEFFRSSQYLTSKRSLPQAAYVIRRAQDSVLARWMTSPTVATLPLTTSQVNALVSSDTSMAATLGAALFRPFQECVVALEYPLDSPDQAAVASTIPKLLLGAHVSESRIRRISFGPPDAKPSLPFGGIYLESTPQRFEDFFARVSTPS